MTVLSRKVRNRMKQITAMPKWGIFELRGRRPPLLPGGSGSSALGCRPRRRPARMQVESIATSVASSGVTPQRMCVPGEWAPGARAHGTMSTADDCHGVYLPTGGIMKLSCPTWGSASPISSAPCASTVRVSGSSRWHPTRWGRSSALSSRWTVSGWSRGCWPGRGDHRAPRVRVAGHHRRRVRRPMNQLGLTHLSLRVDDVDAVAAAIEALGGTVVPPPAPRSTCPVPVSTSSTARIPTGSGSS